MPAVSRRIFITTAAACLAGAASRSSAASNPLARVHPNLRLAAEELLKNARSAAPLSIATLEAMRLGDAAVARPMLIDVPVTEHRITYDPNTPPVTVYVVNSKSGDARPAILHTHGGGFIGGSAKGSRRQLQELARTLGCVIVSVEYRLAPETDWRGSTEDNYAALLWLHKNAASLGVDPSRIVAFGESAGGGHAALLAIKARGGGVVRLAGQVLVYPMLDDRTGSPPPRSAFFSWTPENNRFGWRAFLGQQAGTPLVPAAAVPARVVNLVGLPPTWIGVGSIDLFAAESLAYARRLRKAGVPTELRVVSGGFHGFDVLAPDVPVSRSFSLTKTNALRRLFGAV